MRTTEKRVTKLLKVASLGKKCWNSHVHWFPDLIRPEGHRHSKLPTVFIQIDPSKLLQVPGAIHSSTSAKCNQSMKPEECFFRRKQPTDTSRSDKLEPGFTLALVRANRVHTLSILTNIWSFDTLVYVDAGWILWISNKSETGLAQTSNAAFRNIKTICILSACYQLASWRSTVARFSNVIVGTDTTGSVHVGYANWIIGTLEMVARIFCQQNRYVLLTLTFISY